MAKRSIIKMNELLLDLRYNYITPQDDMELDFARQNFEQEWQDAHTREVLTNVILGIKEFYLDDTAIKNQARIMGDIYYQKKIRLENYIWQQYWIEESAQIDLCKIYNDKMCMTCNNETRLFKNQKYCCECARLETKCNCNNK